MNAQRPRKIPRAVSCLIKGPLGCLAFVLGGVLVAVLFLPVAAGRLTDRFLEGWFDEQHFGSIELGDVWVGSLYGPQTIDSVILRDPVGDEVLRAELDAPALGQLFDSHGEAYGPVRIHVKALNLTEFADGSTNIERALRWREPDAERRLERELSTDVPLVVALELVIDRLNYADARGERGLLENLTLRGTLLWAPDTTELELEGGSDPRVPEPLQAELDFSRPGPGRTGARQVAFRARGAPSVLLGVLCELGGTLARFAGPRVDELSWSERGETVELVVADEEASLTLAGAWRRAERVLRAGPEQTAELVFPVREPWSSEFLAPLLPLVRGARAGSGAAHARARLMHYEIPLTGSSSRLLGDLELELANASYELDPSFLALLPDPGLRLAQAELARALRLRDGRVEYSDFRLPLEQGWIAVDGACDLASAACDLRVRVENLGQALDLGRLSGVRGELGSSPPVAPTLPAMPADPGGRQ